MAAALVLLTACGGGGHHTAAPTSITSPSVPPSSATPTTSTTSTTLAPDTSTVPPHITVAYVDAVLAQLNHIYGDAQRLVEATRTIPGQVPTDLRAIYNDPQYTYELNVFHQALGTLYLGKRVPGDRKMLVTALQSTSPNCIAASTETNYDAVIVSPRPPLGLDIVLRPKQANDDPEHLNTTLWAFSYEKTGPPAGSDAC